MEDQRRRIRLERLFAEHGAAVRAYAARRVELAAADDAVSEVFVIAWLASPRGGVQLAHLRAISAPVRDDIALFTLRGMTSAHLHSAGDPDRPGGGFSVGRGCRLISTVYIVQATAKMAWRYVHAMRRSTARFDAYINGRVAPGAGVSSPRCGT